MRRTTRRGTSGAGILYSTAPRTVTTVCGKQYFVKGPDPEIAFAEHVRGMGQHFALEAPEEAG